jgi:hypothetical protein
VIVTRALLLAVLLISACSGTCNSDGVVGWYALAAGGTNYRINLKSGGDASLLIGGRKIGDFRWTLDESDEQRVELQASGDVYATLHNLTVFASSGASAPTQGVIAMPSQCGPGRAVRTLSINSDRGLVFTRAAGPE